MKPSERLPLAEMLAVRNRRGGGGVRPGGPGERVPRAVLRASGPRACPGRTGARGHQAAPGRIPTCLPASSPGVPSPRASPGGLSPARRAELSDAPRRRFSASGSARFPPASQSSAPRSDFSAGASRDSGPGPPGPSAASSRGLSSGAEGKGSAPGAGRRPGYIASPSGLEGGGALRQPPQDAMSRRLLSRVSLAEASPAPLAAIQSPGPERRAFRVPPPATAGSSRPGREA
jgi:hypothetical protein